MLDVVVENPFLAVVEVDPDVTGASIQLRSHQLDNFAQTPSFVPLMDDAVAHLQIQSFSIVDVQGHRSKCVVPRLSREGIMNDHVSKNM